MRHASNLVIVLIVGGLAVAARGQEPPDSEALVDQTALAQMIGQTMECFGIIGYDNAAKKFVGIWLDDRSTAKLLTEGTRCDKSGIMNETRVCNSPIGPMNYNMTTQPSLSRTTQRGQIYRDT